MDYKTIKEIETMKNEIAEIGLLIKKFNLFVKNNFMEDLNFRLNLLFHFRLDDYFKNQKEYIDHYLKACTNEADKKMIQHKIMILSQIIKHEKNILINFF